MIFKVTGHRNAVTLVKNYDLKLEAPGLAEVSHAIGHGQLVAMGGKVDRVELRSRKRGKGDSNQDIISIDDDGPTAVKAGRREEEVAKVNQLPVECTGPGSSLQMSPSLQMSSPLQMSPPMHLTMPDGNSRAASALMESAGKFVGALGKSIMEGAAPMLDSLIKANMEQITTSAYRYQSGNMEVQKVEVLIPKHDEFSTICLYFSIPRKQHPAPVRMTCRRRPTSDKLRLNPPIRVIWLTLLSC